MNSPQIKLLEYVTEDGKNIFRGWIRSLKDNTVRASIRIRLNRIRLGCFGDCKPVGGGVSEIRIDYGPGYRVYFGRSDFTVVILLCGVQKRSNRKISNWPRNTGRNINGEGYEKNSRII